MQVLGDPRPILAITYSDGALAAAIMLRLAARLVAGGASCAGFVQRDEPARNGRSRCDMVLQCLATGERLKISEDRGPLARGCRLDADALAAALVTSREAIGRQPDVLVVNKFGRSEAEGGGFRPLLADAVERGIPVLIAVPWRNIGSWRMFAQDLATEVAAEDIRAEDDAALLAALGLSPWLAAVQVADRGAGRPRASQRSEPRCRRDGGGCVRRLRELPRLRRVRSESPPRPEGSGTIRGSRSSVP